MNVLLYLSPLPSYLSGTPETQGHLTLFHGDGSRPSVGAYILLCTIQVGTLLAMAWDAAHSIPLQPLAAQPRRKFGTAPELLAQWLDTLTGPDDRRLSSVLPPSLFYPMFLLNVSLIPPLLALLLSSVSSALWWSIATLVVGLTTWSEHSIVRSEGEVAGLRGMRYRYSTL